MKLLLMLGIAMGVCGSAAAESDEAAVQVPGIGIARPVNRDWILYQCIHGKTRRPDGPILYQADQQADVSQQESSAIAPEQRALRCLRDLGYLARKPDPCRGRTPVCKQGGKAVCSNGGWVCPTPVCAGPMPMGCHASCAGGTWKCDDACGSQKPMLGCLNGELVCRSGRWLCDGLAHTMGQ